MSMHNILTKKLSARGFNFNVRKVENLDCQSNDTESSIIENDIEKFEIYVSGHTGVGIRNCMISLILPLFKGNLYEINGISRAIVRRAKIDYSYILKGKKYIIDNPSKIFMLKINEVICNSLENFFHTGSIPPENVIQNSVDNFLKSDRLCQFIPDSAIAKKSIPEMIYFDETMDKGLSPEAIENRNFPSQLAGLVDYASTGAGNNINYSYRLVKGTKINARGELILNDQGNLFCSTIQDNAIGIEYNSKRIHLLRAQYEQSLDVVNSEIPYIRAKDSKLQGMHFNTAIMNLSHNTYEDAIAFSESAAARFKCIRKYTIKSNTVFDTQVMVSVGQKINALTPILDESDQDANVHSIACTNMQGIGIVSSIKRYNSSCYGRETIRIVVEIKEECNLRPGDKITTRGGIKGVAVVVPDNKMPHLRDNGSTVPIDVCLSIQSVYNRQSIVTLWEMAANKYSIDNKEELISVPFNEPFSFKELVDNGYGKMTQLYIKDTKLSNSTYVNPLFFMRNDKIAHEILSYKDSKQNLNINEIPVSGPRASGQRLDMANRENIDFKDLKNISKAMSKKSNGRTYVFNLLRSIKNDSIQ